MYPDVITTNGVNIHHPFLRVGNRQTEQQSLVLSSIRDNDTCLEHKGDVIVLGDIVDATITNHGLLYCKGTIVNSNLVIHGDISIEGACVNTNIYSRGEITLRTVLKSDILSEKSVHILSDSTDSSIHAVENIYANKASITDSLISAGSSISVRRVLRSKNSNATRLCVGAAFMKRRKEYYFQQQLDTINTKLDVVNEVISVIQKTLPKISKIEKSNSEVLRLSTERETLYGVATHIQTELDAYKSYSSKRFGESVIVITSYADNGVSVEIDGIEMEIDLCSVSTQFSSDGTKILRH